MALDYLMLLVLFFFFYNRGCSNQFTCISTNLQGPEAKHGLKFEIWDLMGDFVECSKDE